MRIMNFLKLVLTSFVLLLASSSAIAAQPESELYTAAATGDLETVRRLVVYKRVSPNTKDPQSGKTPMHIAAEKGQTEILKFLLDHKGAVNSQEHPFQETPLIEASQFGRLDCVELLLSRGANVNLKGKYGHNALAAVSNNSSIASLNSSPEQVKKIMSLLSRRGADPNVRLGSGGSILDMPAYSNDLETVRHILANNKVNPTIKSANGETALDLCCRGRGGVEMFDLLTRAGFTSGKGLPSCLAGAVRASKPELVKRLSAMTKPSSQLLALAAAGNKPGDEQVALILLEKTVNINQSAAYGLTPLQGAAFSNKLRLAQALLRKGARVSDSGRQGAAIHLASRYGHPEMVQLLLRSGANANTKNANGETPLHLAVQGPIDYRPSDGPGPDYSTTPSYVRVIELLVQNGADVKALNQQNESVSTVLNKVRNEEFKTKIRQALRIFP